MKVGDYVRTRTGYMGKIININEFREPSMKYGIEFQSADDLIFIGDEHIVKSSSNIIDLIEVGDYVNGVEITEIKNGKPYIEDFNDSFYSYIIDEEDIKSIVTKELFEKMNYKVGY